MRRGPGSRARVLAALLVALTATACGEEDRFEAYCAVVTEEQDGLARDLDEAGGSSGLLPGLPAFERLEAAAPDDIADDWSVLVQRLATLSDALADAGVDPASYDPADPPAEVGEEEQQRITLAAGGVATEEVRTALGNVVQQARDVCGTDLLPLGQG